MIRWCIALAVAVTAAAAVTSGLVAAEVPEPVAWPDENGVRPDLDTTAHSIRVSGPDRTQTSLAAALLLHGRGDYPFSTPDPRDEWWGLATCPYAVIVVAGDRPADAVVAASLSDPTDRSSEPLLRRTASADPTFDPVGEEVRVDTDAAPVVVTDAARVGAKRLAPAARAAIGDLTGSAPGAGCAATRAAIVVGGTGAVPAGVDTELLDLGIDEVFRVAGPTRYHTAATVATALGTGPTVSATCTDTRTDDGDARLGFHGNAAIELRSSPSTCQVLSRTVVVAEGGSGADALAAGWWTSYWQVPVLLTDADGELPAATRAALNSLVIDNVVFLGGRGAIPEETVREAGALASAATVRIAGPDRSGTSIRMAEQLGGWYFTGDAEDFEGAIACLAPSSGSGAAARGWPDALVAGPWCGRAGAGATSAPRRALLPLDGANPQVTEGVVRAHDAVPVLLTPAAGDLAPAVREFLRGRFDPTQHWCHSDGDPAGCHEPGFLVAFGGAAVLAPRALAEANTLVSGTDLAITSRPETREPIWTRVDLGPVFAGDAVPGASRACFGPGDVGGVRWLLLAPALDAPPLASIDLFTSGVLATQPSAPVCVGGAEPLEAAHVVGGGPAGRRWLLDDVIDLLEDDVEPSASFTLEDVESGDGADSTDLTRSGAATTLRFVDTEPDNLRVRNGLRSNLADLVTLRVHWERAATPVGPSATFEARLLLRVPDVAGPVVVDAVGIGEPASGRWELRGSAVVTVPDRPPVRGGFSADVVVGGSGPIDDRVIVDFDGLLPVG